MGIEFTAQETSVLYGLLAEHTDDIIIKTDKAGFIRHASPGIAQLGVALDAMLVWPHLRDLVEPESAPMVVSAHDAAACGMRAADWIEIAAITASGQLKSFAARMTGLANRDGEIYGVVTVLRSVEEVRSLEDRLFAAEMTDPLTGLTNRRAFTAMVQHLLDSGTRGSLALLDIDHFKAFNLRYGQSMGDRVLAAFADFLRSQTRHDDILSRVGGQTFGILLPEAGPEKAEAICRRIVETLAEIGRKAGPDEYAVTVSAGLAQVSGSLDTTLRRADLAMFFAKAKGRNCLELDGVRWAA